MIKLLCSCALVLMFTFTSFANTPEQVASGKVQYGGWGLDKDERREAEQFALEKAIETFVVNNHPGHVRNYEAIKDEINNQLDEYILTHVVTKDNQDKKSKTYEVWVRASINEPKLIAFLVDKNQNLDVDDQAYITFVFVARQVAGKQSRANKSSSQSKAQEQVISNTTADDRANMIKEQTNTITNRSASETFTDKLLYEGATSNEVDQAMGGVFTNANYLVIDAALLEEETGSLLSVDNFIKDYEKGDDLTPSTKSDALKGLKSLSDPIDFLAIGTLDIDEVQKSASTGMYRVSVSITGQVLSVKRRGAARAKVGPVQYFGEGPTATTARNNALNEAATEAGNVLVAQLSAKGIR